MLKELGRDYSQSYKWETVYLSKVHINREPSGQVRIAIVISKRYINEAYDIITGKLRSKL